VEFIIGMDIEVINFLAENLPILEKIGAASLILGINFTKNSKKSDSEFEVEPEEYSGNIKHIDQVEKLRKLKESPETILDVLDIVAKDFLKKKFHIRNANEYSDFIEFFADKGYPQIVDFCRRMNEALYSGQTLTPGNIDDLLSDLESIIIKEDPKHSGYEKKKDPQLYSIIDRISLFENKKEKTEKEEYLGKKTKKIISSKLSKRKEPAEKQVMGFSIQELPHSGTLEEGTNSALSLMIPEDQSESIPDIEPEEDKMIESIDDLDRIRAKIQHRKKNPAGNNQETASQEV